MAYIGTTGNDTIYLGQVFGSMAQPSGGTFTVDGLAGTDTLCFWGDATGAYDVTKGFNFTVSSQTYDAATTTWVISGASAKGNAYTFNLKNVEFYQLHAASTAVAPPAAPPATNDNVPPLFASASILAGTTSLVLTYTDNGPLASDATHLPLASEFVVTAGGLADTVTNVAVSGKTVTLTLANPVAANVATTVQYIPPASGTNAVQDTFFNLAVALPATTVSVVTDVTPPVLNPATGSLPVGETIAGSHPVKDDILIKFNENIQLNTADATAAIELHQGSVTGAVVSTFLTNSVDLSCTGNTLSIHHAAPLVYGSQYTVTFSTVSASTATHEHTTTTTYTYGNSAIKDLAGNIMYSAGSGTSLPATVTPFTFTTIADPFVAHTGTVVDSGPVLVGAGALGVAWWMFFI